MDANDAREFKAYLRNCTNNQVIAVYEKERAAHRRDYAALAEAEAERRKLILP